MNVAILRGFAKRGALGTLRVVAVVAGIALLVPASQPKLGDVAAGVVLVAIGEAWRVWAVGHLHKTNELAVSGPYRHVQHPLYLGRLCILTGVSLMARVPVSVGGATWPGQFLVLGIVLAVFFGYYLPRKRRVEGARLASRHGQAYVDWVGAVPVLLPRLSPYGPASRRWSAARFRENGEAGMLVGLGVLCLAFLGRALA